MNNQLQVSESQSNVVPMSESATVLAIIQQAAMNPSVDMDKMERLMQMHERLQARQAEVQFSQALAEMQIELPVIVERGEIKNKGGGVQSTYALWEDINEQIKPILAKHGFSLSFRTDTTAGVSVTGVLTHRAGHKESTSILLPADASGSKNSVQAVASSVSYGKRYTAGALLNLTSCGEDDDAQSAARQRGRITPTTDLWEGQSPEQQEFLMGVASTAIGLLGDLSEEMVSAAAKYLTDQRLDNDEKAALWTRFDSKQRRALKQAFERSKAGF